MSDRYARHALIPGWSQQRLNESTVCVAGMGALGNEAARLLAMAGVGRMILCDPDRVAESNLSRTVLFREQDIGRLKADAAAAALSRLAPALQVEPRPEPLLNGIGLAELRDASLVLGCLDTRAARLQLSGRCSLVQARLIDGGTQPWGGEVRMYLDPDGPCYGCSLTVEERAEDDVPWSCMAPTLDATEGAAATSSSLVGSWMASMAIRALMGLQVPGGLLRVDVPRGSTSAVTVGRDPECPFHQPAGTARRLGVTTGDTVAALRAQLGDSSRVTVWDAVQYRAECPRGDFKEERWRRPRPAVCPNCGAALRIRTTQDLSSAPAEMTLRELGVAPREILYAYSKEGEDWVELRGDDSP